MDYRCDLCDGPRNEGSMPSPNLCGYCVDVGLARILKRQEFGEQIDLSFFQKPRIESANKNASTFGNALEIVKAIELDAYEKAAELWNRVGALPDPLMGLEHLRKLEGVEDAIEIVDRLGDYSAFRKVLDNNPDEAEVCKFIDERQFLLRSMLGGFHVGETACCLKEFRFGSEFRADFVLISPRRSLPPKLYFVEFEPANDPVFTRKGTPSKRLLGAMKQIREWLDWTQTNSNYFHESIILAKCWIPFIFRRPCAGEPWK